MDDKRIMEAVRPFWRRRASQQTMEQNALADARDRIFELAGQLHDAAAERDALRAEVEALKREAIDRDDTITALRALVELTRRDGAKLRAALEAAPEPDVDGNTSEGPADIAYDDWYRTTRAEALRRE